MPALPLTFPLLLGIVFNVQVSVCIVCISFDAQWTLRGTQCSVIGKYWTQILILTNCMFLKHKRCFGLKIQWGFKSIVNWNFTLCSTSPPELITCTSDSTNSNRMQTRVGILCASDQTLICSTSGQKKVSCMPTSHQIDYKQHNDATNLTEQAIHRLQKDFLKQVLHTEKCVNTHTLRWQYSWHMLTYQLNWWKGVPSAPHPTEFF